MVDDLARSLLRLEHEVTVLSRLEPGLAPSETRNGYSIVRFQFPLLFEKLIITPNLLLRSPGLLLRVWKLVRNFDTVAIGLLDFSALYLLLLRSFLSFRLVLYLHGGDTRKLPRAEVSYRVLLKLALRTADAIIPVSEDLAREAAAYVPAAAGKMRVIPNGIDVELGDQVEAWPHARAYIVFAGRLVPEKDIATLLEAFQIAAPRVLNIDLLICGTGLEKKKFVAQARSRRLANRIRFLGRLDRDQVLAVIKGALFLVLPSRTEGNPMVVIEALAAGTPVIGSRIPAISALVDEGITGALFAPGDAPALARLIEKYGTDRAALALLAAGARGTDRDRFAIRSLVARHLEVYQKTA